MYIVLLRFTDQRHRAREWMAAHNDWLQRGFDDGVFLLAGSLQPGQGGALVAHGCTRDTLQDLLAQDPFVEQGVVRTEVLEVTPGKATAELAFLLD